LEVPAPGSRLSSLARRSSPSPYARREWRGQRGPVEEEGRGPVEEEVHGPVGGQAPAAGGRGAPPSGEEGTTRASGGEAGAAVVRLGQRRGERREIGEKKEKERGDDMWGPLTSTSAKPATKTIRWYKMNDFKS
jgi:hypothetical protein